MGLFSRIFRRKKEAEHEINHADIKPEPGIKKVRLEDVEGIISKRSEGQVIDFNETAAKYKSRFIQHFGDLSELFDKLEKVEIQRIVLENHRDVTDIIRTSRNHYVQSSRKLLSDTITYLNSEEDPERIRDNVISAFDKLNSFSKQAQIILATFKSEMKLIAESLRMTYNDLQNFNDILEKDYEKIKEGEKMKDSATLLISVRSSQKRANERVADLDKDLHSVMKSLKTQVSKRDTILKSNEYMHYERLKDDSEESIAKMSQLLRDIGVQAEGAEKILNTYIHESRDIDKEQAENIKEMIKDPGQLVSNFTLFEEALKKIGKISNAAPSKKKKKTDKKAVKAPHLLVLRNLRELVAEYEKLAGKEERIIKEMGTIDAFSKLKDVNKTVEELETDQKRLLEEKDSCENTISKNHIAEQQKLENYLSELLGESVRVA